MAGAVKPNVFYRGKRLTTRGTDCLEASLVKQSSSSDENDLPKTPKKKKVQKAERRSEVEEFWCTFTWTVTVTFKIVFYWNYLVYILDIYIYIYIYTGHIYILDLLLWAVKNYRGAYESNTGILWCLNPSAFSDWWKFYQNMISKWLSCIFLIGNWM